MSARSKKPTYEVRVQRINPTPGSMRIDAPECVSAYWRQKIAAMPWYDPEREMCVVVLLDTRRTAIGHALVGIGTLNESVTHPRDVFRAALILAAHGVVLAHNHPSGCAEPSEADKSMTRRLSEAGHLLRVPLVDHVIIGTPQGGRPGHFSFKAAGFL